MWSAPRFNNWPSLNQSLHALGPDPAGQQDSFVQLHMHDQIYLLLLSNDLQFPLIKDMTEMK